MKFSSNQRLFSDLPRGGVFMHETQLTLHRGPSALANWFFAALKLDTQNGTK
ncbi:MAG: hypothetical protein ACKO8O_19365 [Betaproteobacteria bacterium]